MAGRVVTIILTFLLWLLLLKVINVKVRIILKDSDTGLFITQEIKKKILVDIGP